MLTREQATILAGIYRRKGTFFYRVPKEIVKQISETSLNPQVNALLRSIDANDESEVRNLLNANPRLLLMVGTPNNAEIKISPFEYALSQMNIKMVRVLAPYFENITNNEGNPVDDAIEVRTQISKKYLCEYAQFTTKSSYDFSRVVDAIMSSSWLRVAGENIPDKVPYRMGLAELDQLHEDFSAEKLVGDKKVSLGDLIAVLRLMINNYDNDGIHKERIQLLSAKVLGFLQRQLSPELSHLLKADKRGWQPRLVRTVYEPIDSSEYNQAEGLGVTFFHPKAWLDGVGSSGTNDTLQWLLEDLAPVANKYNELYIMMGGKIEQPELRAAQDNDGPECRIC